MKLYDLLSPWVNSPELQFDIQGIAADHRCVQPGFVFFALSGTHAHGLDYIQGALNNGAVAVVLDEQEQSPTLSVPLIKISHLKHELSAIAARFFNYPFSSMYITGVTGTNGKTTVAYLLMQAHALLAQGSAYIGTLGVGDLQSMKHTGLTTPAAIELQAFAKELQQKNVSYLSMEVSSHALDQARVANIPFQQAIFTNLTHDHLDYHGSIENYALAKAKLFQMPTLKSIIVNMDDPWFSKMLIKVGNASVYGYGFHQSADVRVIKTQWSLKGMSLDCQTPWGDVVLQASLIGDFNVSNVLAVFTALMAQGFELQAVKTALAKLQAAPGRMQVVGHKPLVIVDYAHTPDALEKALTTLNTFKHSTKAGKLWVVFGCGGNRDPLKRPIMGKIAASLADIVVVTSDNPRNEDPVAIMNQIWGGIPETFSAKLAIEDRKLAIITALQEAKQKDIILIAGKGHEDYQEIGSQRSYFSDQFVVKDFLFNIES
jgi:UDP-N-acetylmuramoyl-L-alanyl-D-glutamate--2,6-diaminopimelate ligase